MLHFNITNFEIKQLMFLFFIFVEFILANLVCNYELKGT